MSVLVRAVVVGSVLGGSLAAQGVKLNEPLARPIGGDVEAFVVSPDGTRVAYVADQETDDVLEMFCAPADGSAPPVKLNGTLAPDAEVEVYEFSFSPDGAWVVFTIDSFTGTIGLWSAPADGSLPAVELGPAIQHAIAPDSERVVFRAFSPSGELELFSCPIDGSAPPVRLNSPLPPGGYVDAFEQLCLFTSDGDTVVYVAYQESTTHAELFAVPTDGSAAPHKLNGPLVAGGEVAVFGGARFPAGIGAGGRVLYVADQEVDERSELYSVPLDGSAPPTKLNGPLVAGGDVFNSLEPVFVLSPDGTRALYLADEEIDGALALHCVPVDGSGPSVSLTPGLLAGRAVGQYGFAPDGARAYFLGDLRVDDRIELFGASVDGSGVVRRLSGHLIDAGDVDRFQILSDGRLVYSADQERDGLLELYRVDPDAVRRAGRAGGPAPATPVKFSGEHGIAGHFAVTPDGAHAVFNIAQLLYGVSLSSGQPVLLDEEFTESFGVSPFQLAGAERVAFMHGGYFSSDGDPLQLFSAHVDGSAPPVRLNDDLPLGPVLGDVFDCDFSPNGDWVVYHADGDTDELLELYVASTSGRRPTRKLSAGSAPGWFRTFHPDGQRTLYLAPLDGSAGGLVPYLARFDGSTPPAVVGGPYAAGRTVGGVAFTPDGTRLLLTGDLDVQGRSELYNAPVDGGAPRSKLSPPLLANDDVEGLRLSPDGTQVLFTIRSVSSLRLWSVPVDGSQPPVPLSDVAHGALFQYAYSPDGQHVLYRAFGSSVELFSVPSDGSQPPTLLSTPLGGNVVEFTVTPNSARVLFLDEIGSSHYLRSAPIGGGSSNALFIASSGGGTSLGHVTPDSTQVVFGASSTGADGRLYRAPVDGTSATIAITGAGGWVGDLGLTDNGATVVYYGEQPGVGPGILRVPVAGGVTPVQLSPDVPHQALQLELSPDGQQAVYATEGIFPDEAELFAVPVDGTRPARRLNRPPIDGRIVNDIDGPRFRISPTSHAVIYRAAREDNVKELYLSLLDRRMSPFGGEPQAR